VDRTRLPAIIHNNEIIYDLNQITNYICMTYGKEDLLGTDMFQKVRFITIQAQVCEIQEIYSLKLVWVIRFFSNFVKTINSSMLEG
jgi:glutathione S-transferase